MLHLINFLINICISTLNYFIQTTDTISKESGLYWVKINRVGKKSVELEGNIGESVNNLYLKWWKDTKCRIFSSSDW